MHLGGRREHDASLHERGDSQGRFRGRGGADGVQEFQLVDQLRERHVGLLHLADDLGEGGWGGGASGCEDGVGDEEGDEDVGEYLGDVDDAQRHARHVLHLADEAQQADGDLEGVGGEGGEGEGGVQGQPEAAAEEVVAVEQGVGVVDLLLDQHEQVPQKPEHGLRLQQLDGREGGLLAGVALQRALAEDVALREVLEVLAHKE